MGYKFQSKRNRKPLEKARRLLFGRVNPEDEERFIQNELQRDYSKHCSKWNFNFKEEKTLDPNGDFIWVPATPVLLNKKRKPIEPVDYSSEYYFSPSDIGSAYLFKPIEPAARSPEAQAKPKITTQSLITGKFAINTLYLPYVLL